MPFVGFQNYAAKKSQGNPGHEYPKIIGLPKSRCGTGYRVEYKVSSRVSQ